LALALALLTGGGGIAALPVAAATTTAPAPHGPAPTPRQKPQTLAQRRKQFAALSHDAKSHALPNGRGKPAKGKELKSLEKLGLKLRKNRAKDGSGIGDAVVKSAPATTALAVPATTTTSGNSAIFAPLKAMDPFGDVVSWDGGWFTVGHGTGVAVPGEQVSLTADVYTLDPNNEDPTHVDWDPVKVTWQVTGCNSSESETYDFGQTVSAPTLPEPMAPNPPTPPTLNAEFTIPTGWCSGYDDPEIFIKAYAQVTDDPNSQVGLAGFSDFLIVPSLPTSATGCGCGDLGGGPQTQQFRGDPVGTATGAYGETFQDASVAAPGVSFSASRTYDSSLSETGVLGEGWRLPWETNLQTESDGDVVLHAQDGAQFLYQKQSDGSFAVPSYGRSKLSRDGSGYKLTTTDHQVLSFNSGGQLTEWTDRSGEGLAFAYASSRVSVITDAAGRSVSLDYNGGFLSRLTLSDGRHVDYSYANGQLAAVRALDGTSTTYGYDAAGHLSSVTDDLGHRQTFNVYDSFGRVATQTDATGGTTHFTYDNNGPFQETDTQDPNGGVWSDIYYSNVLLVQVDPFGNKTYYSYDQRFDRTRSIDPLQREVEWQYNAAGLVTYGQSDAYHESWTYDSDGDVKSVEDGDYNATDFGYDANDRLISVANPLGGVTNYTYNNLGLLASAKSPGQKTTTYAYDADGNLTSVKSPGGHVATRTYDASGRVLSITDPRGNVTGVDPSKYTTTYTYDDADRVLTETDPQGGETKLSYDSVGNLHSVTDAAQQTTVYGYDDANRLTSTTDPAQNATKTVYDAAGQMSSVTDRTGAKTSYVYDAAGRLSSMVTARGNVSGASASAFTWTYGYDKVGNRTSATDPAGRTTTYGYDADNRALSTTDPLGDRRSVTYDQAGNVISVVNGLQHVTALAYDANGRLKTQTESGRTTKFEYDADGNLTAQVSPLGERTTYGYDDDGNQVSVTNPLGNVTGATAADHTWTYGYDAAGNRTSVTDPLGDKSTTHYDGDDDVTSTADALGNTTGYVYDALDRVTEIDAADGGTTKYGYDTAGNIHTVTDANNHVTTYAYDGEGRTTSVTDPLNHTEKITYDPEGNVTEVANARGQKIDSTLDARDKVTKIAYSDGTPTVTYSYDDAGRPSKVVDATGTRTLTYDAADELLSITSPGATNPFKYTYNTDGTISSRTYPDGSATSYGYDADGRVSSESEGVNKVTYGYDAAGEPTSTTFPVGNAAYPIAQQTEYDNAGRITSVTDGSTKTPAATGQDSGTAYEYDADGRVSESQQIGGLNFTTPAEYDYDAVGRLKQGFGQNYTYDKVGNLLTATSTSGQQTTTDTYNAADELTKSVTGSTTTSYSYDADGDQTKAGSNTYSYDPGGRVTAATIGSSSYTFAYDADGNRTVANKNGALIRTSRWDINNPLPEVATDTNGSGSLLGDYHYAPDGTAQSMDRTTGSYYFGTDRQGSVTGVYDSTGTQTYSYSYGAWGTFTGTAGDGDAQSSIFGYDGQYKDQYLTGSLLLRARNYTPSTGTFTTRDPMGQLGQGDMDSAQSAYAYADDDPSNESDPSGACPPCVSAAVGGVIGGLVGGGIYAYEHRNGDWSWGDFAEATGKGALIGAGAALLAPVGGAAAGALGFEGASATVTAFGVNAAVGAGYTWAVNSLQCQPTTPLDLLLGSLGGLNFGTDGALAESTSDAAGMDSFLASGANVRYSETATAIGDDENTIQNFMRSTGAHGHDVIVHGDADGNFRVDGMITHPQQIADAVRENPHYDGGPIQLVTCHGACGAAGELGTALGAEVRNASPHMVDLDPRTGAVREWPDGPLGDPVRR
jgi:RHS repeat-associated protein